MSVSKTCPTCDSSMKDKGFSGDVDVPGGVVGLDIEQWNCPDCGTIVDDDGNAHTKIDQDHAYALVLREFSQAEGSEV